MPSGLTHIMLARTIKDRLPSFPQKRDLQDVLLMGQSFLLSGSVGPDLPYASPYDDVPFANEEKLADDAHYESTNQISLRAFRRLKQDAPIISKRDLVKRYCFFLGYTSHIVADGVIHPFVQDKVGVYKGNENQHRNLEMVLDVFLYNHLTFDGGENHDVNFAGLQSVISEILEIPGSADVLSMYRELIKEVYKTDVPVERIKHWIRALERLVDVSTGAHLPFYRRAKILEGYVYQRIEDLPGLQHHLILEKPRFWEENFLGRSKIHFIEDCVPRFYDQFQHILVKSFLHVFSDGPEPTEEDLPAFNLDTGRPLAVADQLSVRPDLWRTA